MSKTGHVPVGGAQSVAFDGREPTRAWRRPPPRRNMEDRSYAGMEQTSREQLRERVRDGLVRLVLLRDEAHERDHREPPVINLNEAAFRLLLLRPALQEDLLLEQVNPLFVPKSLSINCQL